MESEDPCNSLNDSESRFNFVSEVDEVDKLSTNENKQMDRQIEEAENEDGTSDVSEEDSLKANPEVQTAYKILSDLMADSKKAVNWPFMQSVEESAPELYEKYKKQIEKPMWLKLMKQKFEQNEYRSITEFVSDFRLMLENCYRFNGPDHYISKRGQKLETMLEQKLALLSRELREKTSIEATSGVKNSDSGSSQGFGMRRRQKTLIPHDSTYLLNQLREQEQQKVREWRRQQILDRKAEKEALAQEIIDWEDKVLFHGKYKEQMKAMWEIPQIGLFLFLCQVPLNIGEVMHFELERCFLIPRESSTMRLIMTSLLSTPFQRLKLDKKSLMPYKVWEHKLRVKLQQWYKVYVDNNYDTEKTWLKLGIDDKFFEIVGQKNPLEKKKFHEVTFYKRVWIVKSLCDYCLQTQDSLRETIEVQPFADQREYVLGTDADGKRYIHFPQFCGADVRVYRQAPIKYPKLEIKLDPFDNKRKFPLVYKPPPPKKMRLQKKKKKMKKPDKPSPQPSPSRQRPSRLRQSVKPVIPLQIGDSTEDTDSDTSNDSGKESDSHKMDIDETGDCNSVTDNVMEGDTQDSVLKNSEDGDKNDLIDNDEDMEEDKSLDDNDRQSSGSDVTVAYCDNSDTNSSYSSRDYSRESSPFLPADLRPRRSARLDKSSDASREASPLIYESDYGLPRSRRSRARLKPLKYKASRNLTNFLIDENSTTSNSSAFGEPSISGILTERLLNNANLNINSNSSETGEESNDCDIRKMFTNPGNEATEDKSDVVTDQSKESQESVKNCNSNDGASKSLENESKGELAALNDKFSEDLTMKDRTNEETSLTMMETNTCVSNDVSLDNVPVESLSESIPNGYLTEESVPQHKTCDIAETQDKTGDIAERPENRVDEGNMDMSEGENVILDGASEKGRENMDIQPSYTEHSVETVLHGNQVNNLHSSDIVDESDRDLSSENDASRHIETFREDCSIRDGTTNNIRSNETSDISNSNMGTVRNEIKMEIHSKSENDKIDIKDQILDENQPDETGYTSQGDEVKQAVKTEPLDYEEKTDITKLSLSDIKVEPGTSKTIDRNSLTEIKSESGTSPNIDNDSVIDTKVEPGTSHTTDIASLSKFKVEPGASKDNLAEVKSESGSSQNIGNDSLSEMKVELGTSPSTDSATIDTKVKDESKVNVKTEEKSFQSEERNEQHDEKLSDKLVPENKDEEEEEEEERVPDMEEFELLADSVEDLRKLTMQFEEPEPIIIKKGKKEQITRPPPRKKCVVHLHERLQYLLKELEPWEGRLVQATKRARIRIRKEVEDYAEPLENEDSRWNTTDEETESGVSEDEDDDTDKPSKDGEDSKDGLDGNGKMRTNSLTGKLSRENVSGASTPVKLDDWDEIDISQRGRLRKRRIIPNNAEDQIAPKKAKPKVEPSLIQDTPTSTQPIIIQSGKSQMVDYSDILRQLKSVNTKGTLPPGVNPVLIKTTQGGRTLLTSVLPLNTSLNTSDSNSKSVSQKLQNIRLISPLTLQQQLSGQNINISLPLTINTSSSTKISQHPTIQNLLTGNTITTPSVGKESSSKTSTGSSMIQILPHNSIQSGSMKLQISTRPGEKTPEKIGQPKVAMVTPDKTNNKDQITPQKIVLNQNITPRKIAPHPAVALAGSNLGKGTVKYYAANASTLPINVVQQLLATRGAKLETGPNQQSILYIPMENDGDSRNVVPLTGKYVSSIPTTQLKPTILDSQAKLVTAVTNTPGNASVFSQVNVVTTSKSKSPVTSNALILPKPQTVQGSSPVFSASLPSGLVAVPVQQGTSVNSVSPNQSSSAGISKTVKTIFQSRLAAGGIALNPTSPPRYPTNETVRTLLDKRKSVDEKSGSSHKSAGESKHTTYTCIASQLQRPCSSSLTSSVILKKIAANADSNATSVTSVGVALAGYRTVTNELSLSENVVKTTSIQQHVLTSISPAKLNTLLLQTSAAGAKSIPSLIKLPSKAVLDSAVKAVVTSVHTTLPTVNIKVPSPTSLPSIGPRRNVTKTIQTMKSPIPVAPKVVTQNSGRTSLSVADSHCVFSTQSTLATSSRMGNSSQPPVPSNSTVQAPVATLVQGADGKKILTKIPALNTSSPENVQVGYLTPHGYVIPKLQQNAGSQSAAAILNQLGLQSQVKQENTGNQSASAMQLVQNAEGLLQIVPKVSLHSQLPSSTAAILHLGNQPISTLVPTSQSKKAMSNKQLVAINAQGKHIIVKQKVQSTQPQVSSADLTVIFPKSNAEEISKTPLLAIASQQQTLNAVKALKPINGSQTKEIKPPGSTYLLPQTVSGVLSQAQSPAATQAAFSPLLNMQQVLLPGTGMQLASPVGLNLLQPSVPLQSPTVIQASQNINSQPSLKSPAVQQVVHINQALLNQALLSNLGQTQMRVSPTVNMSPSPLSAISRPVLLSSSSQVDQSMILKKEEQSNTSKVSLSNSINGPQEVQVAAQKQVLPLNSSKAGVIIQSGLGGTTNSLNVPAASTNTPAKQMVFQFAIPTQGILSPTLKTAMVSQAVASTAVSTPTQLNQDKAVPRQLFLNSFVDKNLSLSQGSNPVHISLGRNVQMETSLSKVTQDTTTSGTDKQVDQSNVARSNQSNQKLLLYSIGGQLVTGQGVPVTLHQGVLKVMPQGKLQIANQTLTPEQIRMTLAKISTSSLNTEPVTTQTGQMTIAGNTSSTSLIGQPKIAPVNPVDKNSTQSTHDEKPPVPISTIITNASVMDHSYQHKQRIANVSGHVKKDTFPVNDEDVTQEADCDLNNPDKVLKGSKPNSVYIMKSVADSSGYTVFPFTANSGELKQTNSAPEVREINHASKDQDQSFQDQGAAKASIMSMNGDSKEDCIARDYPTSMNDMSGENGKVNSVNKGNDTVNDDDDDDDDDGNQLVIDDSTNEKEAALNLLTLANQALGPTTDVKVEK